MATIKLTKRIVDTTQPDKAGDVYLFDDEVAGFGLRIRPSGARAFVLQYRVGHGRAAKKRRLVIGRPGSPWTVETARREAKRLMGLVALGQDPMANRTAEKADQLTIAELCREYLEAVEAGRVMNRFGRTKAATTLVTDRSRIDRHIIPLIGQKRVRELTAQDIKKFLRDIAAGKTAVREKTNRKRGLARVTGGEGAATRTVGLLGGIMSYAIDQEYLSENPVRGVQRYADNKNERFLSSDELSRLGASLAAAEAAGKDPVAVAVIRLLILSGCRKSEVLTLKWSYVDHQHACLRLPSSKTGAKIVPLGAAALELLAAQPKIQDNPYVFPGRIEGQHIVGVPHFFQRICKNADLTGLRLHDLRHSFASVGASGGLGLPLIGALLGHKDTKTTARYAHLADSPVKAAADRISQTISAALNGGPKSDVIPLPNRQKRG